MLTMFTVAWPVMMSPMACSTRELQTIGNGFCRAPSLGNAHRIAGLKEAMREDAWRTMGSAAERASKETTAVFVDVITGIRMQDGFTMLRGGDRATSDILREGTQAGLRRWFSSIASEAAEHLALTNLWRHLATACNTALLPKVFAAQ